MYPYDFPQELSEIRGKLSQAEANEALIKQKDEMAWNLISEKQNLQSYEGANQFEEETNSEIQEWAQ